MDFANAVNNTPEIANCYQEGLQALGANRSRIEVGSTRDVKGSVDLDHCLADKHPGVPRWDYVFGYKDDVHYVEVHSADTSNVKEVIAKFQELLRWRKQKSPELENLKNRSSYHWLATSRVSIKGSKYSLLLAKHGLDMPRKVLQLP